MGRAQIGMTDLGEAYVELIDQGAESLEEKKGKRIPGAVRRHKETRIIRAFTSFKVKLYQLLEVRYATPTQNDRKILPLGFRARPIEI